MARLHVSKLSSGGGTPESDGGPGCIETVSLCFIVIFVVSGVLCCCFFSVRIIFFIRRGTLYILGIYLNKDEMQEYIKNDIVTLHTKFVALEPVQAKVNGF